MARSMVKLAAVETGPMAFPSRSNERPSRVTTFRDDRPSLVVTLSTIFSVGCFRNVRRSTTLSRRATANNESSGAGRSDPFRTASRSGFCAAGSPAAVWISLSFFFRSAAIGLSGVEFAETGSPDVLEAEELSGELSFAVSEARLLAACAAGRSGSAGPHPRHMQTTRIQTETKSLVIRNTFSISPGAALSRAPIHYRGY